jgi:glycerol kinase
MSRDYILALDQGTTSSRSLIVDRDGRILATAQQEFTQHFPQPGWVEHDPEEIWRTQFETAQAVLHKAGLTAADIAAIGITNQRETTVVWDRSSGQPIHNAIVWQCRRTADICDKLIFEGMDVDVRARTGLVVDAYFSGTKVAWLLDHVEGARERAAKGELAFGTIDSWLLYKLTGEHATDYSNASRTMMFNIHTLAWDDEMLGLLRVPREVLPDVLPTSGVFGTTSLFGDEIPVCAMCGDQQSALFGQTAFDSSDCKNTYGTGCFVLMNTGDRVVESKNGLISTIAWRIGDDVTYALEGSVFIGGAVIQWLRDELKLIENAAESEAIALQVPDTQGVYVVPAFVGLGAPHWDPHARGIITGLTRGSGRAHIVRAALESIAYQSADVIHAMESDMGKPIPELRVDGGATQNKFLMQHQANVLGVPVLPAAQPETTALGAAMLAGLNQGIWKDLDALRSVQGDSLNIDPKWNNTEREEGESGWIEAIKMLKMRK